MTLFFCKIISNVDDDDEDADKDDDEDNDEDDNDNDDEDDDEDDDDNDESIRLMDLFLDSSNFGRNLRNCFFQFQFRNRGFLLREAYFNQRKNRFQKQRFCNKILFLFRRG